MRLPILKREQLSPDNQQLWDRIMAGRSSAGGGPYGALLHAPALADRLAAVENYFRNEARLPSPDRELIILAAARELGARFPWTRHEIRAREVGTRPAAIETVRANGALKDLTPREALLVEVVRRLLRDHELSDEIFSRALAELGSEQLVETVALVGHYTTIGSVANAFAVAAPEGSKTF